MSEMITYDQSNISKNGVPNFSKISSSIAIGYSNYIKRLFCHMYSVIKCSNNFIETNHEKQRTALEVKYYFQLT